MTAALITDDWRVHASIYTDPAIFAREQERLFHGPWLYVAHDSELHEEDFGLKPIAAVSKSILTPAASDAPRSLDEMEKAHILRVLEECHFNQTRTAELLHIDRVTLHNKLKKYGWSRPIATAVP